MILDVPMPADEVAKAREAADKLNESLDEFCRWAIGIRVAATLGDSTIDEPWGEPEATITDGLGTTWLKRCPECGQDTMQVVRPGKAQCAECG